MAFRLWEDKDPDTQQVIAIKMYISTYEQTRTVWMDGRPHPPDYAPHTWMGFSTGKWEGNILTVSTTHIKMGWLRRNGLPASDMATLTEHFIRHGDRITIFSVTTDPVYLIEPFAKVQVLNRYGKDPNGWLYACDDSEQIQDAAEDRVPFVTAHHRSVDDVCALSGEESPDEDEENTDDRSNHRHDPLYASGFASD